MRRELLTNLSEHPTIKMTTRIRSLTVALDEDIREDDVAALVIAVKTMKNVLSVTSNEVDPSNWATEMRVRVEVAQKLSELSRGILAP